MYLAPLNYDRFFKKVFSDLEIAKRFLEDFFDTTIESIERLPNEYKITDEAAAIEFDFRCKIAGKYVVVDMQQWYKPDAVKRFYLYHCVHSAIQLEVMPLKSYPAGFDKKKGSIDYRLLEPVITLIWLADDTLGVEEDFVAYALTPEMLVEYIQKEEIWESEKVLELLKERSKLLALLDNKTKQIDFLAKNRLIFAMQKNIVKNAKYKRYVAWFKLAEKSKNEHNTKEDFEEFAKDKILSKVIRRLDRTDLKPDDYQYIEDFRIFSEEFKRWEEGARSDFRIEMHDEIMKEVTEEVRDKMREEVIEGVKEAVREEVKEEVKEAVREEVKEEVKEAVREEVKEEVKEAVREEVKEEVKEAVREEVKEEVKEAVREEVNIEIAKNCLKAGATPEFACRITGLPIEIVLEIARRFELPE